MSEWKLAWVKTRTIQGLSGAYEEIESWKNIPGDLNEQLARNREDIERLTVFMGKPKIFVEMKRPTPPIPSEGE